MIHRIWALCINAYREVIRQKTLYTLVFFAGALILFSFFLGQLSLGADIKVIKDVGLSSIMLFGVLIAIFMGIGLISKEVERKTIYTILSKPVSRVEFIVGKYLGLSLVITVETFLMLLLLWVVLCFYVEGFDFQLIKAALMINFELCTLVSIALLFSSYSSQFMSMLFCIGFLVLGHLTDDFAQIMNPKAALMIKDGGGEAVVGHMIQGISSILSLYSLDHFSIGSKIVHGVPVPWSWVGKGFGYAFCLSTFFLAITVQLFRKKDFK
jgi:ABC-type transport system involved in multi-copper enzyme maturation permease subunit